MDVLKKIVRFSRRSGSNYSSRSLASELIGNFDGLDGSIVNGWAATADYKLVNVVIEANGESLAVFESNAFREDLLDHGIGSGSYAFSYDLKKLLQEDATYSIHVYSEFHGVKKTLVSFRCILKNDSLYSIPETYESCDGHLDRIQGDTVRGWALLGTEPFSANVEILIDNTFAGIVNASNYRADVKGAGLSDGYSGFSLKIPGKYYDGEEHEVSARFVGSDKLLRGSPKKFKINKKINSQVKADLPDVKKVQESSETVDKKNYRAAIDKLKNGRLICGWAIDFSGRPVEVEIFVDDKSIGKTVAGAFRGDLKDAGINDGVAAFELMPPPALFDNSKKSITLRIAETGVLVARRDHVDFVNNNKYEDYSEYLRWSYFNKEFYAPFTENDKRVLSYMDWFRKKVVADLESGTDVDSLPLVSIIMPTYKRADVIGKAIDSIVAQSYSNWELIIVDDGGNDDTESVVSQYNDGRIKYYDLKSNKGVSYARNAALQMSSGEFICYLDSDNTWHSDYLLIMSSELYKNSCFDSSYCGQYLYTQNSEKPYAVRFGLFNKQLLMNRNYIDMNAYMHRRSLYENLGGFDTNLRRLVDWDMLIRYTEQKPPLTVPALLSNYYYNDGEETITVSESLDKALDGICDKWRSQSEYYVLEHEAIDFNHDGGDASSVLLNSPFVTQDVSLENYRSKKLNQKYRTAIVLVSYNIPKLFAACVDSILSTTDSELTELIIVDNCSDDQTVELVKMYAKDNNNVKALYNTYNYGFTHAVNQGIELADPESNIVLINNDAIATEGWIEAMEAVIDTEDNVGIVCPQQVLLSKTRTMNQHVPWASVARELDVSVSYHHDNLVLNEYQKASHLVDLNFVPFFCVYIPRSIIQTVGLLDAELGRHYRSDRLYCNAVRHFAHKRIIYTPFSKVYHLHQQSTSSLKKKSDAQYKEIFTSNTWVGDSLYKTPLWEL
tara:strand:- start:2826 stop:5681 length:2856 start_codon:yes stop_codon:yes gene_type:complete